MYTIFRCPDCTIVEFPGENKRTMTYHIRKQSAKVVDPAVISRMSNMMENEWENEMFDPTISLRKEINSILTFASLEHKTILSNSIALISLTTYNFLIEIAFLGQKLDNDHFDYHRIQGISIKDLHGNTIIDRGSTLGIRKMLERSDPHLFKPGPVRFDFDDFSTLSTNYTGEYVLMGEKRPFPQQKKRKMVEIMSGFKI